MKVLNMERKLIEWERESEREREEEEKSLERTFQGRFKRWINRNQGNFQISLSSLLYFSLFLSCFLFLSIFFLSLSGSSSSIFILFLPLSNYYSPQFSLHLSLVDLSSMHTFIPILSLLIFFSSSQIHLWLPFIHSSISLPWFSYSLDFFASPLSPSPSLSFHSNPKYVRNRRGTENQRREKKGGKKEKELWVIVIFSLSLSLFVPFSLSLSIFSLFLVTEEELPSSLFCAFCHNDRRREEGEKKRKEEGEKRRESYE